MESTKKDYMQQCDQHSKDESALRLQLKNLEDEESSNKKKVQKTIKRMNEEHVTRLKTENEASSLRKKAESAKWKRAIATLTVKTQHEHETMSREASSYKQKWKEAKSALAAEREKDHGGAEQQLEIDEIIAIERSITRELREKLDEQTDEHGVAKAKINNVDTQLSDTRKKFADHRKRATDKEHRTEIQRQEDETRHKTELRKITNEATKKIDANKDAIYQLDKQQMESEDTIKEHEETVGMNECKTTTAEHELEEAENELAKTQRQLDSLNKQNLQNHGRWIARDVYLAEQDKLKETKTERATTLRKLQDELSKLKRRYQTGYNRRDKQCNRCRIP